MASYITHIFSESERNCDFCGLPITGHQFGLDGASAYSRIDDFDNLYDKHGLECCMECTTLILGEDVSIRAKNHDAYLKRYEEFMSLPWQQSANPLILVKYYRKWNVRIMRDKYGRRQYGVLLGAAERWRTRERLGYRYEDPRDYSINTREQAECLAFYWVDFVDYYSVKPEDPYSVSDFYQLSRALSKGELPKDVRRV